MDWEVFDGPVGILSLEKDQVLITLLAQQGQAGVELRGSRAWPANTGLVCLGDKFTKQVVDSCYNTLGKTPLLSDATY